jgi:hypothetical protein
VSCFCRHCRTCVGRAMAFRYDDVPRKSGDPDKNFTAFAAQMDLAAASRLHFGSNWKAACRCLAKRGLLTYHSMG